MEEIKIKGPVVPIKSDENLETSNVNESNIEEGLQKLTFTTNKKSGEKAVNTVGDSSKR